MAKRISTFKKLLDSSYYQDKPMVISAYKTAVFMEFEMRCPPMNAQVSIRKANPATRADKNFFQQVALQHFDWVNL